MTNDELAEYLGLTIAEAPMVLPTLSAEQRAFFARMREIAFDAGIRAGPPRGELIDFQRERRARRLL